MGFEGIFTGFDADFFWDFHGLSLMRFQRILVEFEWDQDDIAKFTRVKMAINSGFSHSKW